MAFWGKKRWLEEGAKSDEKKPILPWEEGRVEAAGYRLSVGKEYYVNGDGSSVVNKLEEGESFVISPGEFAFILTKERVQVSKSSIGFISMRVNMKFKGLVNVSGFQINPGFCGKLVFAVFNAGPRHINIRFGDEIFSVWFADLDKPAVDDHEEGGKIPNNLDAIPSDTINGISGEALTAYQLSKQIRELSDQTRKLADSVASTRTWLIRLSIPTVLILSILLLINRAAIVGFFIGQDKPVAIENTEPVNTPDRPEKSDADG